MANATRKEVRTKPLTKADKPVNKVAGPVPVRKEQRVAPKANVALPTQPPKPKAVAKPEVRKSNAPKARTGPVKVAIQPMSKAVLNRRYSAVLFLDENGPEITELVVELLKPVFGDKLPADARLGIMNKGIAKVIAHTGDATVDGTKFSYAEGEIVLVAKHDNGTTTIFNTKTETPVWATFDAKATKGLDISIVPTIEAEFDAFVIALARNVEAHGLKFDWAV